MTTDDLISAHKVTERVIGDMAEVASEAADGSSVLSRRLETLAASVHDLATIQRDLLAAMLRGSS